MNTPSFKAEIKMRKREKDSISLTTSQSPPTQSKGISKLDRAVQFMRAHEVKILDKPDDARCAIRVSGIHNSSAKLSVTLMNNLYARLLGKKKYIFILEKNADDTYAQTITQIDN